MAKTKLGGDHLANSGVGGCRVGLKLQLSGVYNLDFGNIDRDDDAAGWDGGLRRKLDYGVMLIADVSIVMYDNGRRRKFLPRATHGATAVHRRLPSPGLPTNHPSARFDKVA